MNKLYFSSKSADLNQQTALLISAYLQAKATNSRPYYFTPEIMYAELYGGKKLHQAHKKEYVAILNELPYVHHVYDYVYYVSMDEMCKIRHGSQYIAIPVAEFWQFVDKGITRLFSHYLFMIRSFNATIELDGKTHTVGFMPQAYFGKEEGGVSVQTIGRKNELLEKCEIIFFRRGVFNPEKNTATPTYYCKYEDRLKLLAKNIGESTNVAANSRRAVAMRYRHFIEDPSKYTVEQAEQLYEDIIKYNRNLYDSNKAKDPQPILDIINALC